MPKIFRLIAIPFLQVFLLAPWPAVAQSTSAPNLGGLYPLQTYTGEREMNLVRDQRTVCTELQE
jgi:hypothetical protein